MTNAKIGEVNIRWLLQRWLDQQGETLEGLGRVGWALLSFIQFLDRWRYEAVAEMVSITEDEYTEYCFLKEQASRIKQFVSLDRITKLEDDIDLPIKRCVAAFALLGCEPKWSCCGFDYYGQPLHKSHQYGRIFFILGHNSFSERLCEAITKDTDWEYNLHNGNLDLHVEPKNVVPQWDFKDCPHYHEPFVVYIQQLEDYLYGMKDQFAEETTLEDTNGRYREQLAYWQYPTMEAWVIRKEDYV